MFLYERMDALIDAGMSSFQDDQDVIWQNLNPAFPMRKYQMLAFEHFLLYFGNDKLRKRPSQVLFHMATGSGKTMIMAGLMLYLYRQGYRNFLFFVNLSNIVIKTKENFLNRSSSKYLFAPEIEIDGNKVPVREVENFQNADENAINICFTTTQGLHGDLWTAKENAVTLDDFMRHKVVLVSDEAHHLNADTKKMSVEEREDYHSWEETVKLIFGKNPDNVLLEFTATCDIHNENIRREYEDKIIFNYPLANFRRDGFSKEIKTFRTDVDIMDRALMAIVLSQYRLKLFERRREAIKPVVLFKAAKIADSKKFMEEFIRRVGTLTAKDITRIAKLTDNETLARAFAYFKKEGITPALLAVELREAFSVAHCLSANDDKEAEARQIALNTLESAANPYRAIFEVKKLDEGWDVLNLFDIVRLYETRQSGGKKVSPATVAEAQLIGRGSRYCPFGPKEAEDRFKRKYDSDADDEMRICEELYYHCQNDSRYIAELHTALREIGLDPEKAIRCEYRLKESFKRDPLYHGGYLFVNDSREKSRASVVELPDEVRGATYGYRARTGESGEDAVMDGEEVRRNSVTTTTLQTTFGKLASENYAWVWKPLCRIETFRFDLLKRRFPNLDSTREFIESEKYLGNIKLEISAREMSPEVICEATGDALGRIAVAIGGEVVEYEGTREFRAQRVCDTFKDKTCVYSDPKDGPGGLGISQNSVIGEGEWRIDLSKEDWFAFADNFGTTEEKSFVAYFGKHIKDFRRKYDHVWLVRNERQFHLHAFEDGRRFEPDYVLFLHKKRGKGYEQLQVFIEPKGDGFIAEDEWKERFLLQMEESGCTVKTFADDNYYRIRGVHFYNRNRRQKEFEDDMGTLVQ